MADTPRRASPPAPARRALGLGLDSLLPVAPPKPGYGDKSVFLCAIERIIPQRGQPRQRFVAEAIEELAASIREHGLLEPLVVRKSGDDRFEIIAGERRWRASQKAGLKEVLVVVKEVSPTRAFELALVENVQREDLNAIELAEALDRLAKELALTQDDLAKRIGKDRTTVTNSLRLLKLPARVRQRVDGRRALRGARPSAPRGARSEAPRGPRQSRHPPGPHGAGDGSARA